MVLTLNSFLGKVCEQLSDFWMVKLSTAEVRHGYYENHEYLRISHLSRS